MYTAKLTVWVLNLFKLLQTMSSTKVTKTKDQEYKLKILTNVPSIGFVLISAAALCEVVKLMLQ